MTLMTWAILILAVFGVIWIFFVVPAERKHHERKLEVLRARIEKRQSGGDETAECEATSRDDSAE